MALKYVNQKSVKQLVHENGKRASKSFFEYLDRRVEELIQSECRNAGQKSTLSGYEAEQARKLQRELKAICERRTRL